MENTKVKTQRTDGGERAAFPKLVSTISPGEKLAQQLRKAARVTLWSSSPAPPGHSESHLCRSARNKVISVEGSLWSRVLVTGDRRDMNKN